MACATILDNVLLLIYLGTAALSCHSPAVHLGLTAAGRPRRGIARRQTAPRSALDSGVAQSGNAQPEHLAESGYFDQSRQYQTALLSTHINTLATGRFGTYRTI
jgi:hypothetical protein